MKRRDCLALLGASSLLLGGCASSGPAPSLVGTGDLGVVVARSTGTLAIVPEPAAILSATRARVRPCAADGTTAGVAARRRT